MDRGELAADDLASLLDVVTAGPDVDSDQPAVDVLLGVGADGVGEPSLLADLAEEAGRGGTAEDRIEDAERVAALVGAIDAGTAEGDVELLGVLLLEPDPGADLRRLERATVGARRRRDMAPSELDDLVVLKVSGCGHHDVGAGV